MKRAGTWIAHTLVFGALVFVLTMPVFGRTTKVLYPNSCEELWGAVKDTLGNPENYNVETTDDSHMYAIYQPKHTVHVTITGALVQRKNHVTLVPKASGCEMQIVSNYSGFEHDDRGDFKKRVDDSLTKSKASKQQEMNK